MRSKLLLAAAAVFIASGVRSQEPAKAVIEVRADQPTAPISRLLTGACIEDVNHEIYGGLYSQMLFGESFQEPADGTAQVKGFRALGGTWRVRDGELTVTGGPGDKLVSDGPAFANGEVGVEVHVPDRTLTNAGLVVRVANAKRAGADNWDGYEISLNAAKQTVLLGRHRQNFQALRTAACEIPVGGWVSLTAKLDGGVIEVFVNGKSVLRHDDGRASLPAGTVGLRQWQAEAAYRNLWVKTGDKTHQLPFEAAAERPPAVSGPWRPVRTGDAVGRFMLPHQDRPTAHNPQWQEVVFAEGKGQVGVENQGLNRWGMEFAAGKPYEGVLIVGAKKPTAVFVALESRDGSQVFAEQRLTAAAENWQELPFTLTPKAGGAGRFTITLREPGAVSLRYAFLQPGEWGRYKGLPVRRDVAEGIVGMGVTVLRYGGSMVNHREYRWGKMIGPRDRRPPHANTWYPYSSNGWGIPDFLNFCDAAGVEAIPTFCLDETPDSMAEFVRYAKESADGAWGRKRAADGHAKPYALKYLQLGNEEKVDDAYVKKFQPLAEAIWAADPNVILVVGDFDYRQVIRDPFRFAGTSSGITSLAAHQKILQLAKRHNREVWFDVHVWTDGPRPDATLPATLSFVDALEKLADGAKFKVAVFELNANSHGMKRALANALATHAFERDGRVAVVASANGLQPDGQNDNGWDQGLLFLNPRQVWLQPPGYVTQLFARHYQPRRVACRVTGDGIDVTARQSADGKSLVLSAVNPTDQPVTAEVVLTGYAPAKAEAGVTELAGPLAATNTADRPTAVVPQARRWKHDLAAGKTTYTFPPRSVTAIAWE